MRPRSETTKIKGPAGEFVFEYKNVSTPHPKHKVPRLGLLPSLGMTVIGKTKLTTDS
jgi:hypothetical protein